MRTRAGAKWAGHHGGTAAPHPLSAYTVHSFNFTQAQPPLLFSENRAGTDMHSSGISWECFQVSLTKLLPHEAQGTPS